MWLGLIQQTMQCEQMNNFRSRIRNTHRHAFYSHTLCLGLHSKMCRTMNTSDNPELWDIQLSSWLFCELTRQLCPWLTAGSCCFKTSHTMHAKDPPSGYGTELDIRLTQWIFQATAGFPLVNRNHRRVHNTSRQSLSQAISHWQVQRFTIASGTSFRLSITTVATSRAATMCFPHEETQLELHVQRHKLYTKVIAA